MLFESILDDALLQLPKVSINPPKLLDVWEKYRKFGEGALDSVELSIAKIEDLFANKHPKARLILLDSKFLIELDKRTKAAVLMEVKRYFVNRCITNKVQKEDVANYLKSLYQARLQGRFSGELQDQLYRLDLVPHKNKFPPEYLDAWHASVFYLTFRHDIFENRDAHW